MIYLPRAPRILRMGVYPDIERSQAARVAAVARAQGDPIRLRLVDVLRRYAGKVCVCEIEIRETHRVHEHAAAALIRAKQPTAV